MGYTTEFEGQITVNPPLNQEEIAYLQQFNKTRRMNRKNGPYFVDGTGDYGQGHDQDIIDYNDPPQGQPGLWCQWEPTEDGTAIEWDQGEKFYHADQWMQYLIDHFIGPHPIAKEVAPERFAFLQGHECNGEITAQGEESDDRWKLAVKSNVVKTLKAFTVYEE